MAFRRALSRCMSYSYCPRRTMSARISACQKTHSVPWGVKARSGLRVGDKPGPVQNQVTVRSQRQ